MDAISNPEKVLVRAVDLEAMGYTRFQIPSMLRRSELTRISRGLYYRNNIPLSSQSTVAAVGMLVPRGIICLLTALRFHDIGTQNPANVWLAIPSNYRTPKLSEISITVVHFTEPYRKIGIQIVKIDGVSIKITDPVRTIADCFRFRNKIGLDVAMEALEDGARKKIYTSDQLITMAHQCRIYTVMKPYMEAIYR